VLKQLLDHLTKTFLVRAEEVGQVAYPAPPPAEDISESHRAESEREASLAFARIASFLRCRLEFFEMTLGAREQDMGKIPTLLLIERCEEPCQTITVIAAAESGDTHHLKKVHWHSSVFSGTKGINITLILLVSIVRCLVF
jgi:hypothetical protein